MVQKAMDAAVNPLPLAAATDEGDASMLGPGFSRATRWQNASGVRFPPEKEGSVSPVSAANSTGSFPSIPHSFPPLFFSKTNCLPWGSDSGQKHPWKEWKWKCPLDKYTQWRFVFCYCFFGAHKRPDAGDLLQSLGILEDEEERSEIEKAQREWEASAEVPNAGNTWFCCVCLFLVGECGNDHVQAESKSCRQLESEY